MIFILYVFVCVHVFAVMICNSDYVLIYVCLFGIKCLTVVNTSSYILIFVPYTNKPINFKARLSPRCKSFVNTIKQMNSKQLKILTFLVVVFLLLVNVTECDFQYVPR